MAFKFIVTTEDHYNAKIKLGNVDYHKNLKKPNEAVYGGGRFVIDDDKKVLDLFDVSADFGLPKLDGWDTLSISDEWKGYKVVYSYPRGYFHDNEIVDLTNKLTYYEE
jgi:hypothetical protein